MAQAPPDWQRRRRPYRQARAATAATVEPLGSVDPEARAEPLASVEWEELPVSLAPSVRTDAVVQAETEVVVGVRPQQGLRVATAEPEGSADCRHWARPAMVVLAVTAAMDITVRLAP